MRREGRVEVLGINNNITLLTSVLNTIKVAKIGRNGQVTSYSPTGLATYSLAYSLTHAPTGLLTLLLTHARTHALAELLTLTPNSLTYSLTYLLTPSPLTHLLLLLTHLLT